MRTGIVAQQLQDAGDYKFRGDWRAQIQGIQLGSKTGRRAHQYMVIVDDTWSGPTANRLRVTWEGIPDLIELAVSRGVAGFVCSDEFAQHPALEGHNVFHGRHSIDLFFRVAEVLRNSRGRFRVAAVTGSSGKTTTKRMLAHALRAAAPNRRVFASPASFNVGTEVVKHLSRSPQSRYSVIEVAGTAFSVFRNHNFALAPDVGIVTSITEAHLDFFKSERGVARHKAGIFDRPPAGGTAVINLDTPQSGLLVRHATDQGCQIVTYGESEDASVRLLGYSAETGEVSARVGGETLNYVVGARGKHMALNSLAVIATLRSYRLLTWRTGVESLATFAALDGRGAVTKVSLDGGIRVTLIDESYNANPGSTRVSLEAATHDPESDGGRVILVLGDMLELGPTTSQLHADLAPAVVAAGATRVHLFGELMLHLQGSLKATGHTAAHWGDMDALYDQLLKDLQDGDTLLVKSSNGTGLDEIVKRLQA